MIRTTAPGRWFMRVMWAGIAANVMLALPSLAAPDQMAAMNGIPAASPHVWVRFSGLLVILLSALYAPAALDPDRYRANAWLAVAGRFSGAAFFALEPPAYRLFAAFDGLLGIVLGALLWSATRAVRLHPVEGATRG